MVIQLLIYVDFYNNAQRSEQTICGCGTAFALTGITLSMLYFMSQKTCLDTWSLLIVVCCFSFYPFPVYLITIYILIAKVINKRTAKMLFSHIFFAIFFPVNNIECKMINPTAIETMTALYISNCILLKL